MFLFITLTGTNAAFPEPMEVIPMEREGEMGYWISEEDLKVIDNALNYLFLLDEEYDVLLDVNKTLKGEVMKLNGTIDTLEETNTSLEVQRNITIGVGLGLVGLTVLGGLLLW
jgi:hypothetical protein